MKKFKLGTIFFIAILILLIQSLSFAESSAGSSAEFEKLPDLCFEEDYIYQLHPKYEKNEVVVIIETFDPKIAEAYYQRYLTMAVDYEKKAEYVGTVLVNKKRFLVLSIDCFQIAKYSSLKEVKKSAGEGLLRCRKKLVNSEIKGVEDGVTIMQRWLYVNDLEDEKEKREELQFYFKVAQDFEKQARTESAKETKKKYLEAAIRYYDIVCSFTKDEETERLAEEAILRYIKMLQVAQERGAPVNP